MRRTSIAVGEMQAREMLNDSLCPAARRPRRGRPPRAGVRGNRVIMPLSSAMPMKLGRLDLAEFRVVPARQSFEAFISPLLRLTIGW